MTRYDFDSILNKVGFTDKEVAYAKLLVASRLIHPASERETVRWLQDNSSLPEVLDYDGKIYAKALHRVSKKLLDSKDYFEEALSQKAVKLFDLEENIILYDLTNTFFESPKRESEIAKYGRSKEKRYDAPLVTIAMTVDGEGFPKRSKIIKGNVSEPETLEDILTQLQSDTKGDRVPTVIIDAGIATEENLELIKSKGFHYIAVSRKRAYGEKMWEFAEEKRIKLSDGETELRVQRGEEEGEVFLLCKSKAKEQKEQSIQKRKTEGFIKALEAINTKLGKKRTIKKYEKIVERIGRIKEQFKIGSQYEITVTRCKGNATKVEYKRIKKFPTTPGEYVIRTDRIDLTEEEISRLHRSLTRVEAGFRTLKQESGLRPNYHQRDVMMKSHIFVSILAFHFISGIIKRLRVAGIKYTWNTVRNIMRGHVRVTTKMNTREGEAIFLRDNVQATKKQKVIYNALGVKQQPLQRRTVKIKTVVRK